MFFDQRGGNVMDSVAGAAVSFESVWRDAVRDGIDQLAWQSAERHFESEIRSDKGKGEKKLEWRS